MKTLYFWMAAPEESISYWKPDELGKTRVSIEREEWEIPGRVIRPTEQIEQVLEQLDFRVPEEGEREINYVLLKLAISDPEDIKRIMMIGFNLSFRRIPIVAKLKFERLPH